MSSDGEESVTVLWAASMLLVPDHTHFLEWEKLKEMAAYIDNSWGPPQCIGAIDGSHIPILAPQKYQCDNFNRKGWHSIILQEVVDGKGLFWSVYSGMFGSLHNARALILSTFTPFPPNQLGAIWLTSLHYPIVEQNHYNQGCVISRGPCTMNNGSKQW